MDRRIATIFASGTVLGSLLVLSLIGAFRRSPPAAPNAGADPALLAELEALRATQAATAAALERLADAVDMHALAPVGASTGRAAGSASSPPSLEALTVSLDALRASIETESRRTQEAIRAAPAFGGETLGAVRARNASTNWELLEALAEEWRADENAADRSQYFQTARDLLRSYGPPSAIYRPDGSLVYMYRRHAEGGSGPEWYFRIQDGYVVEFFIEEEGD